MTPVKYPYRSNDEQGMSAKATSMPRTDPLGENGELAPSGQSPDSRSAPAELNSSSGGAPQLRWSPDAVRRLEQDTEWARTSNPTGPAEVVGVLLGKSGPIVEITDSQPMFLMTPGDHAEALTVPGKREFERTMAAFQSTRQGGLSVVGIYRSHIGDGFDSTEEDFGLIRTCFRDASRLTLLMQLPGNGSSRIKLFWGDRDQPVSEFHYSDEASAIPRWLELWQNLSMEHTVEQPSVHTAIPTDARTSPQVASEKKETSAEAVWRANPPIQETRVVQPREVPKVPVAFKRRSHRGPIFLAAAAGILAVLIAYPMFKGSKLSQKPETSASAAPKAGPESFHQSGLALRAEKEGDDLDVNWNRNAPVLANASGGVLTIRQKNAKEKQLIIDGDLLRTGGVVYRPVHGDVVLRLVILGQGGAKLGESVTIYPPHSPVTKTDPHKESK